VVGNGRWLYIPSGMYSNISRTPHHKHHTWFTYHKGLTNTTLDSHTTKVSQTPHLTHIPHRYHKHHTWHTNTTLEKC
jgi:hypothetical protein